MSSCRVQPRSSKEKGTCKKIHENTARSTKFRLGAAWFSEISIVIFNKYVNVLKTTTTEGINHDNYPIRVLLSDRYWGESTKHGPMVHGPLRGPGPWTGSIKIWTGSMDQVHGPPIFPTPKNTIENKKKIKEVN